MPFVFLLNYCMEVIATVRAVAAAAAVTAGGTERTREPFYV